MRYTHTPSTVTATNRTARRNRRPRGATTLATLLLLGLLGLGLLGARPAGAVVTSESCVCTSSSDEELACECQSWGEDDTGSWTTDEPWGSEDDDDDDPWGTDDESGTWGTDDESGTWGTDDDDPWGTDDDDGTCSGEDAYDSCACDEEPTDEDGETEEPTYSASYTIDEDANGSSFMEDVGAVESTSFEVLDGEGKTVGYGASGVFESPFFAHPIFQESFEYLAAGDPDTVEETTLGGETVHRTSVSDTGMDSSLAGADAYFWYPDEWTAVVLVADEQVVEDLIATYSATDSAAALR